MRTSNFIVAAVLAVMLAPVAKAANGGVTFRSNEDALRQGIAAFNGGYYELAMPALEAAAESNPALGAFYLARIYSDNEGAYTDHGKAFQIFKKLADELQDTDPEDEEMAPVAAKSLTAVSVYLRAGVADAAVKPDVPAANRALQRAALTFNNEDAQFELAKVLLRGEGPDIALTGDDPNRKIENGRHWLSRLSRNGHSGAQAFLADLLWRGKYMPQDQIGALNLIDVAVANAPGRERVWIEDIYQNIYCNAGEGVRAQATGRVAEWHDRYGRHAEKRADKTTGLDELAAVPERTCANGEAVRPIQTEAKATQPLPYATAPALPQAAPHGAAPGSARGGGGIGVDIGIGFAPDNR